MRLKIIVFFQLLAVKIATRPLQTAEIWGRCQSAGSLTVVVLAVLALPFGPSTHLLWAITWAEQFLSSPEGFRDR